jgi:hypothetical protein
MAGQGFGVAQAAAIPKDYSIALRGIRFTPGEFSDLEVGPLSTLGIKLQSGSWATGLTGLMDELYRSLRTIYGDVIDQFYIPETGRLTLHSPELLLLANAAMNRLESDPYYRAGVTQAEKASTKLQSGAGFAGAVAAKLEQGPNPEEEALAQGLAQHQQDAKVAEVQARIDQLTAELAELRAESGI